jgi:nucleoside-diphosphate kinase
METTLIILKPDAVQRGLMGRIISRFEEKGLQIVGAKLMQISQELAATHYKDHQSKPFYPGLVRFMTSAPVLVLAIRGVGAITICRNMMGATFGSKAAPGSIRGDFGVSNSYNLIHGSDSPEAATRELGLFFKAGEVLDFERRIGSTTSAAASPSKLARSRPADNRPSPRAHFPGRWDGRFSIGRAPPDRPTAPDRRRFGGRIRTISATLFILCASDPYRGARHLRLFRLD